MSVLSPFLKMGHTIDSLKESGYIAERKERFIRSHRICKKYALNFLNIATETSLTPCLVIFSLSMAQAHSSIDTGYNSKVASIFGTKYWYGEILDGGSSRAI